MRKWLLITLSLIIGSFLVHKIDWEDKEISSGANSNNVEEDLVPQFERYRDNIRNVTPKKILPAPNPNELLVERLPPKLISPKPPRPPEPVSWNRAEVTSSGVLRSGRTTIRLAGIDPLEVGEKCTDGNGNVWPCGMFARTAFRQFVRGRPLECNPVDDNNAKVITTNCTLAGFDMSAWLVWQGWAEPIGDRYAEDLKKAKSNNFGKWSERAPGL